MSRSQSTSVPVGEYVCTVIEVPQSIHALRVGPIQFGVTSEKDVPQGALRVVLVEDHPLMLKMLRKLLDAEEGVEVVGTASSGEDALACAASFEPDLMLVDLSLPGMSGDILISRLRRDHPELEAIVVSGHDEDVYAGPVLNAGASAYVMKDDPDKIVRQVRAARDRRARRDVHDS